MKKHLFVQLVPMQSPNYMRIGQYKIRKAYNIFAVNGILFNHEGPKRGGTFVTRKITRAVAERYKYNKGILLLLEI